MISDELLLEMITGARRPRFGDRPFMEPKLRPRDIQQLTAGAPEGKALGMYQEKQAALANAEKQARDAFLTEALGAQGKDARIAAPYRGAWAASLGSGPVDFKQAPQIDENQGRVAARRAAELEAEKTARGAMDKEVNLQGEADKATRELYQKAMEAQQKSLYAGKTSPPDSSKFVPQKPPEKPKARPSDFGNSIPDTDILLGSFGYARKTDGAFDELSPVEKKDVRGALESEAGARRSFNEVIALASLVGKQAFPTDGKRKLMAKINELRAKARVSMGFGVLSDQEMKRLDSIIPDPSSIDVNTVSGAIEVFRELRDASRARLDEKMLAHNIEPGVKKIINGIETMVPASIASKLKKKGGGDVQEKK